MAADAEDGDSTTPSPDEAFSDLGNETRIQILQALGEVGGPLSFTELRNRVGIRQGGRFNYHLDKLVGHFVRKTDAGYELRQAGRRVVEAVLSGALTADPILAPAEIDFDCRLCGAPVELSFREERAELYCTECPGHYGEAAKTRESIEEGDRGILGGFPLPPAGVKDRTAEAVLRAASTWGHLEFIAIANDVCPRCSAIVEHAIRVCEDHEAGEGLCPTCDRRHAVQVRSQCTNCYYEMDGMVINHLVGNAALRSFVAERGIDPIAEGVRWGWDYDEEVLSADPFRARFTFTVDEDSIVLTVDDGLAVVDVARPD